MKLRKKKTTVKFTMVAKKPPKTAICTDHDSYEVYEGYVNCPYCRKRTDVGGRDVPPKTGVCYHCANLFNIKWKD
jgi:hypothetical protein